MSLPRYPKYKDSGVEWLREVPEHWQVQPNKAFLELRKSVVGSTCNEKTLLSLTLSGVIPRDVESGKGKFPADFGTYQDVAENDLVICLFDIDETPRTVGLARESGMITGAYDVFRCKAGAIPQFVFYYYLHIDAFKGLRPFYTGLRKVVRPPTFMAVKVPLPPAAEQTRIAAFLDQETAKIDALVAEQHRLMELLKEKRQAVISHAVTKGLNPNAPMKPSGIEWLGDVPAHWEQRKLSQLFRAGKGKNGQLLTKEFCGANEGDYPVYSGQTENEGVMGTWNQFDFDFGDAGVLFSTTVGAKAMHLRQLFGKFSLSQNCMIIWPTSDRCLTRFFYYHFQPLFQYQRAMIPEHMQASFRMEDLYGYAIALPPREEQAAIVNHLDSETTRFDTLTAEAQRAIDLLQERRTALISAAVTGQIDVRKETT